MQLPVFENAYLLQSFGWAIVNSFWQVGILWLVYKVISSTDKKLPALLKYNLGIVLLFTSFIWFIFTILQNYCLLISMVSYPKGIAAEAWILKLRFFNNLLPLLAIFYLILLCLHIVPFIKNLSANRLLQNQGLSKAPVDIRLFATQTALHLGINKKVRVWLSEQVDVPSVTGFIKPVILLPLAILTQ
ncbi:MAG: hypothetical protein ABIS01_01585 [Ferruginibacter sp.]